MVTLVLKQRGLGSVTENRIVSFGEVSADPTQSHNGFCLDDPTDISDPACVYQPLVNFETADART